MLEGQLILISKIVVLLFEYSYGIWAID